MQKLNRVNIKHNNPEALEAGEIKPIKLTTINIFMLADILSGNF